MPEVITQIVVYEVHTGDGSGSYDACLLYDEWEEVVTDIKAALDHGRDILIERTLMTRGAYEDGGATRDDYLRKFRGEPASVAALDPVDGVDTS